MVMFRLSLLLMLMLMACNTEEGRTARPYAFHKLELPAKDYVAFDDNCPFTFERSKHSKVTIPPGAANNCWLDIEYPNLNAKIHLTYAFFDSKDGLGQYINDTHRMTYKHTVKASSIEEIPIQLHQNQVYGFYFKVGGNAASSSQFYVTDSVKHFLRGAVYFESESRADSLEPLIAYVRADLEHMLETFRWK